MCGSKNGAEVEAEIGTRDYTPSRPSKLSFFSGKHQEMFNTINTGGVKELN